MFEVAELKNRVSKEEYDKEVDVLREQLLEAQQLLESASIPVLIVIAGVDSAGKGDMIGKLNEWFDPRYMTTHAFGDLSDEERERPLHWHYWMRLPPRGHIGVYAMGWYGQLLSDRLNGHLGNAKMEAELSHINKLEKELVEDGALILKYWLHLSKKQQEKRVQKLEENPETSWRISEADKKHLKLYGKFVDIVARVLRQTSTPLAPWLILNAYDPHYRRLTVARDIVEKISARFAERSRNHHGENGDRVAQVVSAVSLLSSLDGGKKLDKRDYQEQLALSQGQISRYARKARQQKRSTILVFEGWDAAGKGGVIRRITQAMDARNYRVIPITAPTDEEKAHHYLWRFWRQLPHDGSVTLYDRSWYGRVLVERVEKLAMPAEWMRAYSEINDFEEELTDHGVILLKFWMHIDKEEQLKRFKERENTSYKRYKITDEDYRNRDKWDLYEQAVNEMITRTSTEYAPWRLIEANDKYYGRIRVFDEICKAFEKQLD
ncbi:MAG: polyphosphate:AMP phosphotransferase [Methylococcaceae bacterium]|nr:polyphosphate:AMP phosphotransferase [Methylococcaceae bacterium]